MRSGLSIAILAMALILHGPIPSAPAKAGYPEAVVAYDAGDFQIALAELTRLAESGHAKAEFLLGAMFFYGNGVAQDNAVAAIWFHKSAIKGDPNGQLAFGSLHIRGIGVRQDLLEAYSWLTLAANNGVQSLRQQAVLLREQAAKLMTHEEIVAAQESASAFTPRRAGLSQSN
jgi:TPR repeat protein